MKKSKKQITFPEGEACRNCGTQLEQRYCSCCGQDRLAGAQRSFSRMVIDIFSNTFAFDNKTWVSIAKLLFRPGFLSKEYISGRIVSYMQPIKMFWIMVLIFSVVYSFHDHTSSVLLKQKKEISNQQQTESVINENITVEEDIPIEEVVKKEPEVMKGVASDYFQYLPYFMLLVIPIFTAFLALFFRKEKYAFSEHLIFAIHLHTVFFFIFTVDVLIAAYLYKITLFFVLIILLYTQLAAFKFYHTRKKIHVIWRMFLIGLLYTIILLALLILLIIILGWIFDIESITVNIE